VRSSRDTRHNLKIQVSPERLGLEASPDRGEGLRTGIGWDLVNLEMVRRILGFHRTCPSQARCLRGWWQTVSRCQRRRWLSGSWSLETTCRRLETGRGHDTRVSRRPRSISRRRRREPMLRGLRLERGAGHLGMEGGADACISSRSGSILRSRGPVIHGSRDAGRASRDRRAARSWAGVSAAVSRSWHPETVPAVFR